MGREIIFIYITCPDEKVAKTIGHALVEENLIACANILPKMTSIYSWKDKIHEDSETVLLLKTRKSRFNQVSSRVRQLHPYETPCVVALPVVDAEKNYAQWITTQTF